ncbi:MAG: S8 family serine peptidase [Clostridiales bacterium]|nr:S8 family serine peptidase [Clostridiales bacterium]
MRKNKWISLIVSVLLITSVVFAFSFGGNLFAAKVLNTGVTSADTSYEAAQDELKQDVVFVSGTAGVDAKVLKAEREEQNPEDDFIVTAIGRNLNAPKEITTAGEEVKEESTVPETKPADVEDPEKVPFDISEPEIFESGDVEYADNQILIKFVKSFDGNVDKELKDAGVGKLEPMFETETGNWYVAYLLKDTDINETMETVRAMNKVVVAEYNFKSEPASIDTDPISEAVTSNEMADQQWVLKSCGIQAAWDYLEDNGINPGGSSSVTVAVIDTGVDYNHKDLAHNIWVNNDEIPDNGADDDGNGYVDDYYGVDMTSKNGSGMDDHGHGTHVAGIIAAENNDIGVVGIAYNTKVMPVKAGDASGYFLQSNIAEAIIYAYSEGADVINMSFGGGASSVAVRDALETAYSRCVLVAAAGNNGMPNEVTDYYLPAPNYPGDYKFVLGVMSSDINDIESGFSNWDARRFNSNEYEVYAPGNDIMSTIPGDRYASLSGTSMASPVVAAQAALLRSLFNDPDIYPTKFIYGQISGTSDETISCCNPKRHTVGGRIHNLPGRVNYINSFTNMPKPEISVSDYTIFDTAGFTADTSGIAAEAAEVNNGDGIIDNGEVIALGFTLRNRWGMSKDSVVSINATNDLGVTNPYVTILNNDVNYGSVGTYSEQDAGRIIDNDMWTGWEKPFYLKIADNCPNDYTITLNVSIESKNGLDETDTATYGGSGKILLVVRNGVILPNKITEDMTLTSDNYYIIPNSTIIMEGATVTVEPGTKIQFWTNDPQDSYADTAITYLKVQGQFLCKGTEEEPVELFPSDLMGQYRVEIYSSDNGFVSMEYTNVSNPYITIERASNCCFKQVYANSSYSYRSLNNGTVNTYSSAGNISIRDAVECSFYKLGGSNKNRQIRLAGKYTRCAFIDSGIYSDTQYDNSRAVCNQCVFYGNNNKADGSMGYAVSSYTLDAQNISFSDEKIYFDEAYDKYYIFIRNNEQYYYSLTDYAKSFTPRNLITYDLFANNMGGKILSINSEEEYAFIADRFEMYSNYDYWCGIHRTENGRTLNYDNTEVPKSIPVITGGLYYGPLNQGAITFEGSNNSYLNYYMLEVPGNGLATDIKLDKYVVNLETGGTHQIEAEVTPVTVTDTDLKYLSDDESVATVDYDGVITAVAPGTAQIKVFSQDMAIYNYVTVNVTDYVAIEGLGVAEDNVQINIGDTKKIKPVFTPSNTTRTAVTYESSDENVATVSSKGVITAVSEGNAIITLTGEDGLTASVNVHVVIPVESISFSRDFYETNINGEDDSTVTDPTILPEEATNKTLIWESTNLEICMVEDGRLIKNSSGVATLRATVQNTELSDEITVIITDNEVNPIAVKTVKRDGNYTYAITEAGEIYVWGSDITRPQKMPFDNVEDAYIHYQGDSYILDKNGNLDKCIWDWENYFYVRDEAFGTLKNIECLSSSNYIVNSYHAIDTSGAVWAWGSNSYGKLGDGSETYRETPVQIDFESEIVKVLDLENTTAYLDVNGNVYISGGSSARIKTPVQKTSGAEDIYSSGFRFSFYSETDNQLMEYSSGNGSIQNTFTKENESEKGFYNGNGCYYFIDNGIPFVRGNNGNGCLGIGNELYVDTYMPMIGVSDVKDVIMFENNSTFVITNDGTLCGTGNNYKGILGIGTTENVSIPTRVEIFSTDYSAEQLVMTSWNGASGTVKSDGRIELTFNIAAKTADDYSMITLKDSEDNNISISKSLDLNKLTITPKAELTDGATYTLTIPQAALKTRLNGSMAEALTLSFTYQKVNTGGSTAPDDEGFIEDDEPITDDTEETHSIVVDEEKLAKRETVTSESLRAAWEEFSGLNINASFYSNVILNRLNDDDVTGWLRITAPDSDSYQTINLGYNYWGTTNEELINKQILDFDDYQSLADIDESNYLTEAPSDTFPFVTQAYLTVNGGKVDTVGNEEVTFVVDFNRAMDTSIPLDVKFGSSYPYAEYTIDGEYVSETEWQGTVTLTTLIENGYQYFSISNGKAAGTSLQLYEDWGRFPFKIDTASAQSLLMQGTATEQGIELTWTQDDFETLAGYNVYRSDAEDGLYQRVNKTVIPADTKYLLDDTVEPGVKYYYNFTVVQSDMTESEPSGKVQVTSLDTMAPNIYHTPVATAYKGSNLVISATIIDNVGIETATLYYREAGTTEWKTRTMDANNDKYSAVVNSSYITDAGLEYYIEAFDGIEYTYKGSAEEPFFVMVQEAFSASDLGDVDGNGFVELKDAMMLLMAVNDRLNLDADQFKRADLDGNGDLSAKEALKIINYINGTISSLN